MPNCTLCGEPMPAGEEMFKFHGYSGPCPKPPLPKKVPSKPNYAKLAKEMNALAAMIEAHAGDYAPIRDYSDKLIEGAVAIQELHDLIARLRVNLISADQYLDRTEGAPGHSTRLGNARDQIKQALAILPTTNA